MTAIPAVPIERPSWTAVDNTRHGPLSEMGTEILDGRGRA